MCGTKKVGGVFTELLREDPRRAITTQWGLKKVFTHFALFCYITLTTRHNPHENWVGVLIAQGWTPGQFKSSRSHREQRKEMKPEDFMDKEDYIVRFSISLFLSS
jgi:hypothetical protein